MCILAYYSELWWPRWALPGSAGGHGLRLPQQKAALKKRGFALHTAFAFLFQRVSERNQMIPPLPRQPSHTAANPLISSATPHRLKGSVEPCGLPFTQSALQFDTVQVRTSSTRLYTLRLDLLCWCKLFNTVPRVSSGYASGFFPLLYLSEAVLL